MRHNASFQPTGIFMHIDFEEMNRRLGRPIPQLYREFIESGPSSRYEETLADLAEICALNLAARAVQPSGPTTYGFVLYGQDGDYYLLRDGDDSGSLYSWSHETRDISLVHSDAQGLLNELATTPIPTVEPDCVILSRVEPYTQSMLFPIEFSELPAAADGIPDVAAFEYSEAMHPLTNELIQFYSPGIVVAIEGREPLLLRLIDGYLLCDEIQKPLPEQVFIVAQRLSAHVLTNDD
jgi:hypothetical protein